MKVMKFIACLLFLSMCTSSVSAQDASPEHNGETVVVHDRSLKAIIYEWGGVVILATACLIWETSLVFRKRSLGRRVGELYLVLEGMHDESNRIRALRKLLQNEFKISDEKLERFVDDKHDVKSYEQLLAQVLAERDIADADSDVDMDFEDGESPYEDGGAESGPLDQI